MVAISDQLIRLSSVQVETLKRNDNRKWIKKDQFNAEIRTEYVKTKFFLSLHKHFHIE